MIRGSERPNGATIFLVAASHPGVRMAEDRGNFVEDPAVPDNHTSMSMTREEFDAKQEAAAARMDARFAAFQAEVSKSLHANDKAMDQFRIDAATSQKAMADFRTEVVRDLGEIKAEIAPLKNVKTNIWGGVIAIIATMGTMLAIGIASFDTGRDTSAAIAAGREATTQAVNEAKQLTADTKRLLEEIKANQAAPGK